jgi:hypothetical protein
MFGNGFSFALHYGPNVGAAGKVKFYAKNMIIPTFFVLVLSYLQHVFRGTTKKGC